MEDVANKHNQAAAPPSAMQAGKILVVIPEAPA
jgi:hypothetical protein